MDTIKVRKANSVISIPADQKDVYMSSGYDVVGAGGVVVEAATPNDVPTLQARLAEVAAENARLKEQIKALQAGAKRIEPVIEENEKPKRTRTKKS